MSSNTTQAIASGDLQDLVSSSTQATIYPSLDTILAVLNARFRADLPYTRIGASNLIIVNPYKSLANTNDASANEYQDRCFKDTSIPIADSPRPLQPHLYELAAQTYLLMRRLNQSQSIIARGITASGKSSSLRLVVDQILRLSSHSKRELKVVAQIKALHTLLDSFGNAKTFMNPNASRHSRYLELHFNERGHISSAKVLTFGLDKSRLTRLSNEERTYHVFYQLLAGASNVERDALNLEDPSDYALLASSGCYRLPYGPFSDDFTSMSELRASMSLLGFRPKHTSSIFNLLVAILLLGNIQFRDGDARDVSAYIFNTNVLDQVSHLLGTSPEDLAQILTNKTSYVRKELYTVLLNAEQSARQRDQLVRDLYAILFAFIVETANHRLAMSVRDPTPPSSIISIFDQAGFQSKGPAGTNSMSFSGALPLVSPHGHNGFDEFCINFVDELVQSYVLRHTFDNAVGMNARMVNDGVTLPSVSTMDNGACIELLRGTQLSEHAQRKPGGLLGILSKASSAFKSGKSADHRNENLLQDLVSKLGAHASFVPSPSVGAAEDRNFFSINHYSGTASYDIAAFVEKDSDLLDSAFVPLLRGSSDPFVSKLFSGPSLASEKHQKDENTVVHAQVSSRPLRQPTILPAHDLNVAPEEHPQLDPTKTYPVTSQLNFTMSEIFASLDRTRIWTLSCIRPNDSGSPNSFDKRRVKAQIRSLLLPDFTARRSIELMVDVEVSTFCERFVPTTQGSDEERIAQCARANGWSEGEDFIVGHRMVWLSYRAWKMVEDPLRERERELKKGTNDLEDDQSAIADDVTEYTHHDHAAGFYNESSANLLSTHSGTNETSYQMNDTAYAMGGLRTPNADQRDRGTWIGHDVGRGGEESETPPSKEAGQIVVHEAPKAVEAVPTSRIRRMWLWVVWGCTWYIPSFLLSFIGRMKRPDIRLAWREKFAIFWLILLLNAIIIFWIVLFGKLLCPEFDKAWSIEEVAQHTADNDYWVAIQGVVYDVADFVKGQHSDIEGISSNTPDVREGLAGQDLTYYFPPPLILACPNLVQDDTLSLTPKNFTPLYVQAIHTSGTNSPYPTSKLAQSDWYTDLFKPKINKYRKGPVVYEKNVVKAYADDQDILRNWVIWENGVYDLSDYLYTQTLSPVNAQTFTFLDPNVVAVFGERPGQDVTKVLNDVFDNMDANTRRLNQNCLNNAFFIGDVDFRKSARCQTQNYILISFSAVIMASMGLKFLAALQLGSKRSPELQDKFVLCQVPCYTEGEDSLRRTIDTLAALNYDDKRKLIFVICDGNIIGGGNDRTTPRIVLDILGVDPKLDPEPLLFKSVGEGSKALNYGKVYSGLYEFEGHVVPYMVVVKVGKPTERSKPGNRGKRDSQILLMHYLNRVHFDAPMSPLELEIYHQMRNVIGIDPAFYEYIFTVDADTTVTPDSLNRLIASCADDSSIIGICGETRLENEEGSWWTMIQVYEYYISHHLSKAFESLFGSVTCLPGCFSVYRIRTADKGRPILISNRVIDEYAEPNVDTLHKKNLFSLGEDRFLTTLLMKHFPTFKTKFCPDAIARTMAPESSRVLFSQRRRWINSTVHNLCELVMLPELFGFCCFSMRFFVFIDLLGTLILPATVVYLGYLIITVATGSQAFPILAIIMLSVVYGLQAIIFILKREFMLVGWMVVYILSYPVYSFFLPIYSFWCMDEFGWGNTRVVIGEGKDKKVVINENEKFDESMIPLKKFSEYEAEAWDTQSRHSDETGHSSKAASRFRRPAASREDSAHASQAGDYYRDTNRTNNSNPNLNLKFGGSQVSLNSFSQQPAMSPFGVPQNPFMPFSGGPGSVAGSVANMNMGFPMGFQNTGSVYGMPVMPVGGVQRNTMMSNFNMFANPFGGSQAGGPDAPPSLPVAGTGPLHQRRMSTFSMATSVNPFAGPSMNPNPSDEELVNALRNYLSTQDLMTITKKTAREAIVARFPKANLTTRKDFLNQSIDTILSET